MQNYNNYGSNYGNMNGVQGMNANAINARNNGWNSNNNAGIGYQQNNGQMNGMGNMNGFGSAMQFVDDRVFVAGRIGADAYQLQPGVSVQVLWDDEERRFYVKGYDEKGRLRVLEDNVYQPYVEPAHEQQSLDMSMYATKDDIRDMIDEAFKKTKNNNNKYVTVDVLDKRLSELCVGSGGKVVRASESDA